MAVRFCPGALAVLKFSIRAQALGLLNIRNFRSVIRRFLIILGIRIISNPMHSRITQLNDLIRDAVSSLFVRELSLKEGVIITVARVSTARNLRSTHVAVSVFPESERPYAMKTLEHESRELQKLLHRMIATRPLPKLFFELDTTEERADEVEHLLMDIRKSDAE